MKVTIELPDDLYRRVKARSALEGRSVRDAAIELFRNWLREPGRAVAAVSVYDLMKDDVGSVDSGLTDLGSNPAHLDGFGADPVGDR